MTSLSGFIVASPAARDFMTKDFVMEEPAIPKGATMKLKHTRVFNLARWDEYSLRSFVPLGDETAEENGPFDYLVYIVRGYSKLLVLSHRRRIVEVALAQVFSNCVYPNLRKVPILIDEMIDFCQRPEAEFLITSLHGKYSGSGTDLRSISLYGDDVSRSTLFVEHHGQFNFHTCGLGRRLFDGLPKAALPDDGEVIRIASDGFVSLKLATRAQATEIQSVVDYVMVHRWVEDWVPEGKGPEND